MKKHRPAGLPAVAIWKSMPGELLNVPGVQKLAKLQMMWSGKNFRAQVERNALAELHLPREMSTPGRASAHRPLKVILRAIQKAESTAAFIPFMRITRGYPHVSSQHRTGRNLPTILKEVTGLSTSLFRQSAKFFLGSRFQTHFLSHSL